MLTDGRTGPYPGQLFHMPGSESHLLRVLGHCHCCGIALGLVQRVLRRPTHQILGTHKFHIYNLAP